MFHIPQILNGSKLTYPRIMNGSMRIALNSHRNKILNMFELLIIYIQPRLSSFLRLKPRIHIVKGCNPPTMLQNKKKYAQELDFVTV